MQNKLIKNTKICFVSAGVACLHVDKRFAGLSPSDLLVESKIKFTIIILSCQGHQSFKTGIKSKKIIFYYSSEAHSPISSE